MPGMRMSFLQPIEMRVNEMIAGVRSDVGVKVFGDDLDVLKATAREIEAVVRAIPGAADVTVEQVTGQPVLQITVDRAAIGRYGIPARDVLDVVEALGTRVIGAGAGGRAALRSGGAAPGRVPRTIRRSSPPIPVRAPGGERVPLGRLTTIREVSGPTTIQREWAKRRLVVQANVRGRDLGGFVDEVRQRIAREVELPAGYFVRFGGQFENLERAQRRLMVVVPLALALIFGAALPHLPAGPRQPPDLRRRPVRDGRRRRRAARARAALLDLRGGRVHRPLGRVGARRHGPRLARPPAPRARPAARRGDPRGGALAAAAGAHDRGGGGARLPADGAQHRRRRGGAAPARDGRHRRRDLVDAADAARAAGAVRGVRERPAALAVGPDPAGDAARRWRMSLRELAILVLAAAGSRAPRAPTTAHAGARRRAGARGRTPRSARRRRRSRAARARLDQALRPARVEPGALRRRRPARRGRRAGPSTTSWRCSQRDRDRRPARRPGGGRARRRRARPRPGSRPRARGSRPRSAGTARARVAAAHARRARVGGGAARRAGGDRRGEAAPGGGRRPRSR